MENAKQGVLDVFMPSGRSPFSKKIIRLKRKQEEVSIVTEKVYDAYW